MSWIFLTNSRHPSLEKKSGASFDSSFSIFSLFFGWKTLSQDKFEEDSWERRLHFLSPDAVRRRIKYHQTKAFRRLPPMKKSLFSSHRSFYPSCEAISGAYSTFPPDGILSLQIQNDPICTTRIRLILTLSLPPDSSLSSKPLPALSFLGSGFDKLLYFVSTMALT